MAAVLEKLRFAGRIQVIFLLKGFLKTAFQHIKTTKISGWQIHNRVSFLLFSHGLDDCALGTFSTKKSQAPCKLIKILCIDVDPV